jgi:hypothetical protein
VKELVAFSLIAIESVTIAAFDVYLFVEDPRLKARDSTVD